MGPSATSARVPCGERERLFQEFKSANQELIRIHAEEIQAAIDQNADSALGRSGELTQARKRRDRAAEELKRHMEEHRC